MLLSAAFLNEVWSFGYEQARGDCLHSVFSHPSCSAQSAEPTSDLKRSQLIQQAIDSPDDRPIALYQRHFSLISRLFNAPAHPQASKRTLDTVQTAYRASEQRQAAFARSLGREQMILPNEIGEARSKRRHRQVNKTDQPIDDGRFITPSSSIRRSEEGRGRAFEGETATPSLSTISCVCELGVVALTAYVWVACPGHAYRAIEFWHLQMSQSASARIRTFR